MTRALIFYHVLLFPLSIGMLLLLSRLKGHRPIERSILLIIFQLCVIFLGAALYPLDGFGRIQLLAWGMFLYFPLFLLGSAVILFQRSRAFSIILSVIICFILAVALDAFLIEPGRLQVSRISIHSSKLGSPLKAVLLADIQTDRPGPYEARVLALAAEEKPDLILFAGDYIQLSDPLKYQEAIETLNEILLESKLEAPLGAYAIQGNVDWDGWEDIFRETQVQVIDSTKTLEFDLIVLTGLGLQDAGNSDLVIDKTEKFHLVLGHSPSYSLGEIQADLLLAGHTHGGQFQLPGVGPLLTLSAVPRGWASGLTEISPGQNLLVSRGIGLERGNAPRMRFLCRPELIVLYLEPAP